MAKAAQLAGLVLLGALAVTPALAQDPAATAPPPAPAAPATDAKPDWMAYKNPYVGEETDIANPHRNSDEIAAWARQAATDVLSFGPGDYREKIAGFKKYFAATGWQLYADYLRSSNTLTSVTTEGQTVGAIADGQAEIVNSGPVDNAYHWIVKVPLTISFSIKGANGAVKPTTTGKYTLFLDLARTAATDGDGIVINNWRVDPVLGQ